MDEAEKRRRIAQGHEQGSCPNRGTVIERGKGYGSGRLADGIFCSLDCQAVFHEDYYRERIRASRPSEN